LINYGARFEVNVDNDEKLCEKKKRCSTISTKYYVEVFVMVTAINLPLRVYEDLTRVSAEFSLMAKKPVSQSMAIDLLMEIYRAHMNNPCALDTFSQQLRSLDLMTPEEFDKYWDETVKKQTTKPKIKRKKKPS
jgi:hypothetical protein